MTERELLERLVASFDRRAEGASRIIEHCTNVGTPAALERRLQMVGSHEAFAAAAAEVVAGLRQLDSERAAA